MKLKVVTPDGGRSMGTEVCIDGKKLNNVTEIAINAQVNRRPVAVITFLSDSVEVDGDFLVYKDCNAKAKGEDYDGY